VRDVLDGRIGFADRAGGPADPSPQAVSAKGAHPLRIGVVPLTLRKANDFVAEFHRHSGRTVRNGGKFAIAAEVDGEIVGIAIVGNPVSATLMDGYTAEVLRCCVMPSAPRNACSFLYGRCWRVWQQMGGRRLITYTLTTESGASLRGAGWKIIGKTKPHARWQGRKDGIVRRTQAIYALEKLRWEAA
jgi:hypothetical protein